MRWQFLELCDCVTCNLHCSGVQAVHFSINAKRSSLLSTSTSKTNWGSNWNVRSSQFLVAVCVFWLCAISALVRPLMGGTLPVEVDLQAQWKYYGTCVVPDCALFQDITAIMVVPCALLSVAKLNLRGCSSVRWHFRKKKRRAVHKRKWEMGLIELWSKFREQRPLIRGWLWSFLLKVPLAYWLHLLVRWSMKINKLCNGPCDPANLAHFSSASPENCLTVRWLFTILNLFFLDSTWFTPLIECYKNEKQTSASLLGDVFAWSEVWHWKLTRQYDHPVKPNEHQTRSEKLTLKKVTNVSG